MDGAPKGTFYGTFCRIRGIMQQAQVNLGATIRYAEVL